MPQDGLISQIYVKKGTEEYILCNSIYWVGQKLRLGFSVRCYGTSYGKTQTFWPTQYVKFKSRQNKTIVSCVYFCSYKLYIIYMHICEYLGCKIIKENNEVITL